MLLKLQSKLSSRTQIVKCPGDKDAVHRITAMEFAREVPLKLLRLGFSSKQSFKSSSVYDVWVVSTSKVFMSCTNKKMRCDTNKCNKQHPIPSQNGVSYIINFMLCGPMSLLNVDFWLTFFWFSCPLISQHFKI